MALTEEQKKKLSEMRKLERQAKNLIYKMQRLEKDWKNLREELKDAAVSVPKQLGDVLARWNRLS